MDIVELKQAKMSRALAYAIGLSYPLYKSKEVNGRDCILGCVNHNPGFITDEDLAKHFKSVRELFDQYEETKYIEIKDNTVNKIQPKKGFSLLIPKKGKIDAECLRILDDKVVEITNSTDDIKKEFVKGCFDGRSSWDTTMFFLSIDVDRDTNKQARIETIITSLGIKVNINNRGDGHPKNDQIRIRKDSICDYVANIGMYSTYRLKLVEQGIKKGNIR